MDSTNIRESDPMLVDKRNENDPEISTILSRKKFGEKIESSNCDDVRGESSQSTWRYVPGQGFHRYKNALGNLAPIRRKKKENQSKPVDSAGFFSFVIVTWVSKYMYRGYKKGFTPEDWPRLSPYDGSDSSADRLEKLWNDEVSRRGKEKACFGKVAWRFIRTRVIISNTLFACSTVCGFISQTLLMRKLLEHVESVDDSYEEGIKWAVLLILGEVLRLFLFAWTWAIAYRTAVRFKLACMVMLYRKIIRLNHLGNTGIGELVNLFSNDCQRVLDMVMYGPMVIGGPIMTICGVWYILKLLGPMALLGILVFVIFFPTQYSLSRLAGYLRGKTLKISDTRIRLTNEILDCIKLIKMYAWEKCFRENLLDIRKKEQRLVLGTNYCQSFSIALSPAVPIISAIITFLAHVSTGQNLTAAQAFPISAFFGSQMTQTLMRSKDGYQMLCESSVSFERLKKVLLIEDGSCRVSKPIVKSQAVAINHGTFAYGASARRNEERIEKEDEEGKDVGANNSETTRLKVVPKFERIEVLFDITFEAKKGQLIGICGQVGSGKSSLLLAALGQLHTSEGQVMREGSCAYVSQQAWIVNETLRDNILFGESFDPKRYYKALQVCNLTYDLEMMPGGDQTEIGERGINLSGGQKQRVALARALYANRDIYFLDDPLSAVDAHVGSYIFDHLILGALHEKTVLFVTHQIQYLNRCDDVYMMRDGRIVEHGTHDYLMKMNGEYGLMVNAILAESAETTNTNGIGEDMDGQCSENNEGIGARTTSNRSRSVSASSRISTDNDENVDKANVALTEAEKSEEGVVKASTYMTYIAAAGGWFSTVLVFLLTLINVGSSSFSAWWLAKWLNAGGGNITDPITNTTTVSNNINDNPNFSTYQSVYAASIGLILGANLLRSFIYCKSTITASTNLHNRLFQKITSSTMRFFDTTPTGRIQNLFSRDMDEVDNRLPIAVDTIIQNLFLVFSAICLVCFVFPWLIIPMCGLGVMYYFFGQVYRIALRGLKRVESTSRSPILSCVMATVQGLSTIHAFDKSVDFKRNFSKLVDDNSGYLFMSLAATRWLAVRIDSLAILTISITAVLVVFTKGQVLPASAGLALTYSAYISGIFQYTIRVMSEAETQFISVERMNHYINLPETEGDNGKAVVKIDASWPRAGVLKFEGVFMSYGKDKPLVLRDVTFAVNPREKIGIVGRTGSGKSSLTVALFRLVELTAGKIMIDDVDISEVRLEELRSRLSIIPQDPVLFSGTIRSNLDPFKKNSDSEIWEALDKTKLKDRVRSINGQLDASVGFGGDSLSVGERQLLCLARAVLRHAKILVLDEATAAVDPETEIAVQNTIQREFVDSTVLTIAHRLQTVVSCDRILVMDDGRVAEFDTPSTLLADKRSQFSKMMEAAEKATKRS